jgi:hypothetical protein
MNLAGVEGEALLKFGNATLGHIPHLKNASEFSFPCRSDTGDHAENDSGRLPLGV